MVASNHELSPEELNELLSGLMPDIPGYQVMRRIGRGGMCYVYLGLQTSLDRQVAIKVMAPECLNDEVGKQRFEKEARTIAKLEHPCIVGIHEVGRTELGLMYYVLPYLSRGHLGQRDLTDDELRVIEVLRSLLSALDYAHARGIVHRDVKAENVLFDNADRPVLTDFGIAVSKRDSVRMTGGGMVLGSSGYMAPEQARGERVDGRADLYSVGVLAFEMLAGHLPFRNPDSLGLALMHSQDPVPPLPPAKQHWQAFVEKAMAKSPKDRYANAREMLKALEPIEAEVLRLRILGQGAVSAPATRVLPRAEASTSPGKALPASARQWNPRQLLLAGVVGLGVLVLSGIAWMLRGPAEQDAVVAAGQAAVTAQQVAVQPTESPASTTMSAPFPAEPAGLPGDVDDEAPADGEAPEPVQELPPGQRELQAARTQIARGRLSLPPGDNAFESLQAARQHLPVGAAMRSVGERWIGAATPHLLRALEEDREEAALALLSRAGTLTEELGLAESAAWTGLQAQLTRLAMARLEAAHANIELEAVRAAKAYAGRIGIAADALEPLWSRPIVQIRPGQSLTLGSTSMRLLRLPAGSTPGLAAMPTEVTRDAYAAFASETGRAEARCRNRGAGLFQRKRSWRQPGFAQAGDHPVVCISVADAQAYAEWLGQRDGTRYRLPTSAEWAGLAGYAISGDACESDRLACGGNGTVPAAQGSASPQGLRGLRGNVREWLSDCSEGCRKRMAGGAGWRDAASHPSTGVDALDGDQAFDDVGFRLLREVAAGEVELR